MKIKNLLLAPYSLLLAPYSLLLILCSCGASKPIATVHTERIEERLKPIPISADTIEITLSRDARLVRPPKTSKASTTVEPTVFEPLAIKCRLLTVDNIKSTRGINVKSTHTDSTTRIKLTLTPDTIYVPYTTHIRSDTIIAPDPTTKAKLTTARWQIVALILILIAITIIFLKDRKTR